MILKLGDVNTDQNPQTTWNDLSWELLENLDRDEIQKRNKIRSLKKSLQYLFWWDSFLNYHEFTKKEMESGRWAWLYTIIKYDNEDTLVYIWWWEFNTDVFNIWWIPEFKWLHNSPLPLFVISQTDSFSLEKDWVDTNVKDYLNKNSIIVVPRKWEAYINSYWPKKNQINFNNINIKHLKDATNETRLAIIHKEFPNWQFQTWQNSFIDTIQKFQEMDFEKFYNTTKRHSQYMNQEMERLIWCFRHMWITQNWKNEEKTYRELYNLIQSFNTQEQKF